MGILMEFGKIFRAIKRQQKKLTIQFWNQTTDNQQIIQINKQRRKSNNNILTRNNSIRSNNSSNCGKKRWKICGLRKMINQVVF